MSIPRSQFRSRSPASTRRAWLASVAAAVVVTRLAARQLPPGVSVATPPPCDPATTPTPARRVDGYRTGAPWDGIAGRAPAVLVVTGTVAGVRCGPIAGATVDWWHLGDPAQRGRTRTDPEGRYRYETRPPAARTRSRGAAVLGLRVDVPGKTVWTSCLFLPDGPAGDRQRDDGGFDPRLVMTPLDRRDGRVSLSFNVILDL